MKILYTRGQASLEKIVEHLTCCNALFIPPLSSKVNIEEYAQKLLLYAERFEAWKHDQLVGLVAVYVNDPDKEKAFITNVSVLQKLGGRGIAKQLIEQSLSGAKEQEFKKIVLEVSADNHAALGLYKKMHFIAQKLDKSNTLTMSKYL